MTVVLRCSAAKSALGDDDGPNGVFFLTIWGNYDVVLTGSEKCEVEKRK
jgi:hypothetical protein